MDRVQWCEGGHAWFDCTSENESAYHTVQKVRLLAVMIAILLFSRVRVGIFLDKSCFGWPTVQFAKEFDEDIVDTIPGGGKYGVLFSGPNSKMNARSTAGMF